MRWLIVGALVLVASAAGAQSKSYEALVKDTQAYLAIQAHVFEDINAVVQENIALQKQIEDAKKPDDRAKEKGPK